MEKLMTYLRFALKVLIALFIINAIFDVLGASGMGLRSYLNNPVTALKAMFGAQSSG